MKDNYLSAIYRVNAPRASFDMKVGEKSLGMSLLFAETGHRSAYLITANNPFGKLQAPHMNVVNNEVLYNYLTGNGKTGFLINASGRSPDGLWEEPGFLVMYSPESALEMALLFKQDAYLHIGPLCVPELIEINHVTRQPRLSTSSQA